MKWYLGHTLRSLLWSIGTINIGENSPFNVSLVFLVTVAKIWECSVLNDKGTSSFVSIMVARLWAVEINFPHFNYLNSSLYFACTHNAHIYIQVLYVLSQRSFQAYSVASSTVAIDEFSFTLTVSCCSRRRNSRKVNSPITCKSYRISFDTLTNHPSYCTSCVSIQARQAAQLMCILERLTYPVSSFTHSRGPAS